MFCVSELDRFPLVLVDLVKSYIEPELQLAEVGIACEDPKVSDIAEAGLEWVSGHPIFLKKWTKVLEDGRILFCNPKWLEDDFDRKGYESSVERNLRYYVYPEKCIGCDRVLLELDEIWAVSHAVHLRWTPPAEFLYCEKCVVDYYNGYEYSVDRAVTIKFYSQHNKETIKEMKVYILEPHNSPIAALLILTEVSGFSVTKYLTGRSDEIVQTDQSESVDEWTDRIAAEVLGTIKK